MLKYSVYKNVFYIQTVVETCQPAIKYYRRLRRGPEDVLQLFGNHTTVLERRVHLLVEPWIQ